MKNLKRQELVDILRRFVDPKIFLRTLELSDTQLRTLIMMYYFGGTEKDLESMSEILFTKRSNTKAGGIVFIELEPWYADLRISGNNGSLERAERHLGVDFGFEKSRTFRKLKVN